MILSLESSVALEVRYKFKRYVRVCVCVCVCACVCVGPLSVCADNPRCLAKGTGTLSSEVCLNCVCMLCLLENLIARTFCYVWCRHR